MSPRDVRQYLHDITVAGRRIVELTADKSLDDYTADWVIRAAVERQFLIVGEALRRTRDAAPEFVDRISDAEKIIAFRNQVVHGYDAVDDAIVWGIIDRYLPVLLEETQTLRDEITGSSDQ